MSTGRPIRAQPMPAAVFASDPMPTAPDAPTNFARETEGNLDAIRAALEFIQDNQTSTSQKTQVTNFPATQPISGTVAVSGTVPVSGAFFQVTQPVSAAALPLPTGASTEATLALIKAKTDNLDVALSTRTKPGDTQGVSGAVTANQGTAGATAWKTDGSGVTQPVSGTFFQATQPVSASALPLPTGASTDASLTNGSLRGSVSVSNLPATQPVSGTFFQTTQPISAAALPLPANSAQEAYGNLDTIANAQEAAMLASIDVGRNMLSTRGSDRTGALFSERGSR